MSVSAVGTEAISWPLSLPSSMIVNTLLSNRSTSRRKVYISLSSFPLCLSSPCLFLFLFVVFKVLERMSSATGRRRLWMPLEWCQQPSTTRSCSALWEMCYVSCQPLFGWRSYWRKVILGNFWSVRPRYENYLLQLLSLHLEWWHWDYIF